MKTVQALVATIDQKDTALVKRMNIASDAIIANQAECEWEEIWKEENIRFVTTKSRGVGNNRNIALNLANADVVIFADDDFVFKNNYKETVLREFTELGADLIAFNFRYHYPDGSEKNRVRKTKRLRIYNALQYGACALAIRLDRCRELNLQFSPIFGGGSLYGSGEDSLFILESLRGKLKVFSSIESIGDNYDYESTWFTGYDEKYFHDKGAWVACAFPRTKNIIKWYYVFRFTKLASCNMIERLAMLNKGIRNYRFSLAYSPNDN